VAADDSIHPPYLTVQERPARNMAARLEGTLTVDDTTNCIVVRKADWLIEVAWPPGCSVVARGDSFLRTPDLTRRRVVVIGWGVISRVVDCGGDSVPILTTRWWYGGVLAVRGEKLGI
jgi:hypothetical protein